MKIKRAFAGLLVAAPHVALEVSRRVLRSVPFALVCFLAQAASPHVSRAQVPVYEITPVESSIKFDVESSAAIRGNFNKWDATLTFQSRDVSTGVLEVRIQADSVDTGSGLKNGKLRGKDFLALSRNL
jgi:polyisoprenoid-binding protein YceI